MEPGAGRELFNLGVAWNVVRGEGCPPVRGARLDLGRRTGCEETHLSRKTVSIETEVWFEN